MIKACIKTLIIALALSAFMKNSVYASFVGNLASESAVVIDARTGAVIAGKNIYERSYPASVTKVMTALLLIEYAGENGFDERVTMSRNAVYGIEQGSSHIAMNAGETLSLEQCLYAILIASANEVAVAVAEHIGGSVEGFADMMNARAKELGANSTNFTNPHGLHDTEHYTTAYDMALIMREAVKYEVFEEVISARQYTIPFTEKNSEPKILNNKNRLVQQGEYYYPSAVGSKTGYTTVSRNTLATFARTNGAELICVVFKAENLLTYADTISLCEYAFSRYANVPVDFSDTVPVMDSQSGGSVVAEIDVAPREDITLYLPDFITADKIALFPVFVGETVPPVAEGDTVGTLKVVYEGVILNETELIAVTSAAAPQPANNAQNNAFTVFDFDLLNSYMERLESRAEPMRHNLPVVMALAGLAGIVSLAGLMFFVKALFFNKSS